MMQFRAALPMAVLSVAISFSSELAQAAPNLTAYALSAAGESVFGAGASPFSCATFALDPQTSAFSGVPQVGLPTDGPICGVGVDTRSASAATGSILAASTLSGAFGASTDPKTFVGSSAARAGFGNLGARAQASYTGNTNSGVVAGSQAFGRQTEPMTFGGSTGVGRYRPTFTVDGSLFGVGREYSDLSFFYSVGNGPLFLSFRILDAYGVLSYVTPGGYVAALPGFTTTGDLATGFTVAGSTTFTLDIPIDFGAPADVNYWLWSSVLPSSNAGLLTPSAGNVEFLSTVRLTGIDVIAANGQPLTDFSIVSGSGTLYDHTGVVAGAGGEGGSGGDGGGNSVPEPGSAALVAFGLSALARSSRRISRPSSNKESL